MKNIKANYRLIIVALAIVVAISGMAVSSILVQRVGAAPDVAKSPATSTGSTGSPALDHLAKATAVNYASVMTPLTFGVCDTAGPIEVESSGGTVTPTAYATLTAAFAAINAGTHTGTITIDVCGNTDETTGTALLNASGSGSASYTSIMMAPAGGAARTITGATTNGSPTIDFSGADNVTIDGLNTGGNSLTIANTTAPGTSGTSTIRFIGGATNNTITNCSLQGSKGTSVATNGAVVTFSTDAVTANGNDNNTISNNNIGPAGANLPTTGIQCNGSTTTTAIGNSGLVINNNNIFDFFGAAVTSAGITVNGGCNGFSITNNRFYQTGTRTWTTGALNSPILMNSTTATSGVQGMTITGNIVGYASNTQTGTYTLTGSTGSFRGIVFNGITGGTVSNVNNNTVASVSLTGVTASGTSTSSPFIGMLITNGLATTNNNTIGSQSATGSMTFSTTTTTATDVIGIYNFSVDVWSAANNNVGGISATNLGASGTFILYGMRANTGTGVVWTATSNNIGGTVANSIQLTATGTASQVIGMNTANAPAVFTSNVIRNLTTNIGTGTTTGASLIGINITTSTPNHTVSQNTIFNLSNTDTAGASVVTGIQFTGSTANVVERNNIYGLTAATSSATAEVNGIRVAGGTTTYRNNMIAIGAGINNALGTAATNSSTSGVNGINEALGTDSFFHNSVYIGGSPTAGTGPSYAFNGTQTVNVRSFRDNIFFNARSNSGATGKNYAIKVNGTTANPTGLTINNNLYFTNGSGGVFGFFNSLDVADLATWKTAVGQDVGSFFSNPQYNAPTAATPDLHLHPTNPTVAEGNGVDVGVTNDFDGQTRSGLTPVDIGADAGNYVGIDLAPPVITFTPLTNTTSTSNRLLSVTLVDVTGVATGGLAPRVYFNKNAGSNFSTACALASGTTQNGTWNCTIDYSLVGGVVTTDVVRYFVVAQDTVGNLGANPSAGFSGTDVNTVSTPPTTPNQYNISSAVSGIITVPGMFPSLTNAGGAFEFINNNVVTGNVTIQITADLTTEAGTVALNAFDAPNTLTIVPTVAPRTISGSANTALIRMNGASRVTIDGSTSGGTDRSLTITNTSVTTPSVVLFGSVGTTPVTNDTLKNCVVINGVNTSSAVVISDATVLGNAGVFSNITIQNNDVQKAFVGVFATGGTTPQGGSNLTYTQNKVDTSGANAIRNVGLYMQGVNGATVTNNSVGNFSNTEGENDTGIWLASGTTNGTVSGNTVNNLGMTLTTGFAPFGIRESSGLAPAVNTISNNTITNLSTTGSTGLRGIAVQSSGVTVAKNKITGIQNNNTGTFGAFGIDVVSGNDCVIQNNFISDVNHVMTGGSAFGPDFGVVGIRLGAGTGHKVYHNSVNLFGLHGGTATTSLLSAAFSISTTTQTGIDVRNNIFANNITGGTTSIAHVSVFLPSGGTSAMNLTWNNNSYYFGTDVARQGVGQAGTTAGTNFFTTLAALQAYTSSLGSATNDNASLSSTGAVPYLSSTDLHITGAAPEFGTATTIASVTDDIDGDGRPGNLAPEIGADEVSDTNAPDTSILTNPSNPTNSSSASFTFNGSDTRPAPEVVVSFECKLDAAAFAPCTSPVNLSSLTDGSHTFQVRAKDANNNVDPSPASFTWVVDTTAPDTSIDTNPGAQTGDSTPTFTFSGNDGSGVGGVTFQCQVDGGGFSGCTSPFTTSALADGSHTFQVRATDAVGNTDASPASFGFTVDATAPDTSIVTNPTDPTTATTATFTFTGNDGSGVGGLTFQCQLDGGGFSSCTSPQNYMGLSVGSHTFQVRATDAVGNTDASPASFTWTINASGGSGPVTVTATAGTPGPTDYPSLKDAIDAINAGTHQGAITVSIVSNTTETATSVLNSSGAGAASYTSINIRPVADGVNITGPSVSGRGLIELNGADNVTIDGDNPNTAGTNRNLTISNTAANTVTFTSVIRIALAATVVNSADNVTIKNLILNGNATGRNIAAAISATGTENTVFGILAGAGGSTVSGTTAPAAVTSVTTTVGAGATANNLTITNNAVTTVARAVSINGAATTVFPGLLVNNNTIGNPVGGAVDQVYSQGVTIGGSANAVVSGNTIYVEGFIQASASTHGIDVGLLSVNTTGATVERNVVARVENNDSTTWPAYGINLGGGNNHVIRNNFVRGISTDQVGGTGAFSTTFGSFGIRVGAGTGHKVYHNSVHLTGAIAGTTNTLLTAAFGIVATGQTGCDVRNNIFSNQLTGGNPTGTRHADIYLPSAATVAMNLTLNNNDYFEGVDPNDRMAQVGTTFGTGEFTAANFDPTQTTPATNFRSYTSTLSAAGTNDNASKKVDPLFVSATDLHITLGSPMINAGVDVGVTNDIDGDARVLPPDIGADENAGAAVPNDIAATAILVPVPGSSTSTGGTVTPQASFTNFGTATQTNVGVRFTITGPGGFSYLDDAVIPSINPGQTINVTFAASSTITASGSYTTTALVTTPDANNANDSISASFSAFAPLSGTYTVGTGGDFTSLTNPGGIFSALNGGGATGNITINITSDLSGETGTVALNQIAGGFTVLLQPSGGAARTIVGSGATGLINLNGADGVTINGLNTGGNSLLIRNTGAGATIRMVADASNNTVQNCTVEGAATTAVILIGTGTTTGNDNVAITNNTIRDRSDAAGVPASLIQSAGTSAAIANSALNISNNTLLNFTANGVFVSAGTENLTVTGNDVSQSANRATALFGINVATGTGTTTISQNTIHGLRSSFAGGTFVNTAGIFVLDVTNGTVSRNRLYDFPALAAATGRIVGIEFEGGSGTASTLTVANNMVSIVTSVATAQSVFGIFDFAFPTNTFNGSYNTVYLGGTASGAANSWGMLRGFDPTTHTLRNNIAFNNRTGGTGSHFAAGDQSAGSGTYSSNYNFFAGTGATAANFMDRDTTLTGASTPVSFATWQAGPPARDANSIAGVASTFNQALFFVDANGGDLHLLATATQVLDAGTPLGTVTTDYDNDPRSATTPDIGADEFVPAGTPGTLQFSSATYSVGEAGPTATITVTRTGGTTGAVGASYATVAGGSATGGAACGGAVDYVDTSGMVSFANGDATPQTFNIPICSDTTDEPDETVNLALTTPTGGATLGTPNTAVLTITDDDSAPTISINDVAQNEGNVGPTPFSFSVTLSNPSSSTVTVHYQTADGTATVGNNDYVAIPDTLLTFNPGVTSQPVVVTVNGDTTPEPNETFFVNLSTPSNATINDGQGQGTINNDDAAGPAMTISDARVTEGNNGDKNMTFTVTFNGGGAASAHYHTVDGTAQADVLPGPQPEVAHGNDYVPEQNGIVSFGANPNPEGTSQTRTFNIIIHGDTFKEPNEFFSVVLDQPIGATITDGTGYGVIVDEDRAYVADIDGDRKTDFTVFRPSDSNWYTLSSNSGSPVYQNFGLATDRPVPGDYDGDGKQDYAVRRPGAQNVWWLLYSSDVSLHAFGWGVDSDQAVQADYDGDDKTDVAVFRDGTWYILRSSNGQLLTVYFGQAGDTAVPGDFDGDGKADFTVFRAGTWYTMRSSNGSTVSQPWGAPGDRPVAGDFDGDGRFDYAVFRTGTWYILRSLNGDLQNEFWGQAGDVPVAADYDGDGTTDVAVFRPANGVWYVLRSSNRTVLGVAWGQNNDIPIPAAYQP